MASVEQFIGRRPDGRAIYRYRLSSEDYERLRLELVTRLPTENLGRGHSSLDSLFCLFAAEWWRRKYEGGAWSWHGVRAALHIDDSTDNSLRNAVKIGLEHFDRPLIRDAHGRRRFVMTLACEGGLPLRMLGANGSRIRRYFKAILDDFHAMGMNGHECGVELESVAAVNDGALPALLRNDVVHRLAGTLVAAVWRLRTRIDAESAENPISQLNRSVPDWRDDLPLLTAP